MSDDFRLSSREKQSSIGKRQLRGSDVHLSVKARNFCVAAKAKRSFSV